MKIVVVKTYTEKRHNADGQHDPAGTWVLAPSKNLETQIGKAEGIAYLVHYKDGQFESAYKVNGFITERRDLSARANGLEPEVKISVGVRFSLGLETQATKSLLKRLVEDAINIKDVRASRVLELS